MDDVALNSIPKRKKRSISDNPGTRDTLSASEQSISERSRRSLMQSTDWSLCIVCQKVYCKREKKLHKIETFERAAILKQAASGGNDQDLLHRIQEEDLIARDAVYHQFCMQSYIKNVSPLKPHPQTSALPSAHESAFNIVLAHINDGLLKEGKAFLLSDLLRIYKTHLPGNVDKEGYRSFKLQEKLVKHYGKQIMIEPQRGQGKSNIIIGSMVTTGDAIRAVMDLKDDLNDAERKLQSSARAIDKETVLREAASILKEEIDSSRLPGDYPSPCEVSIDCSVNHLPPSLIQFITWLLDNDASTNMANHKSAEETRRRAVSITECIVFSSGKGLTPQHVGLAVHLHHEYGSRSLIDTLHAFGFCISYDEFRRLLTSTAQQEVTKINSGVYLPSGILPITDGGNLVHEGDDNIDVNTETIDGKDTLHSMARVVFQQQSGSQTQQTTRIKRGNDKSLPLSNESQSLMQCKPFQKPPKRQEPPRCSEARDKFASCKRPPSIEVRDLSWILMRLPLPLNVHPTKSEVSSQVVPFWSGFNSQISERTNVYTATAYAPIIDAKPADMSTVYTTMCHAKNMSEKLGQEFTVQTMDQQLFAVAQQVKWSQPEVFGKHVIRLGGFHALACFVAAIGNLWGDGGLRDMLCDSDVYAGCTVEQMLRGKQFNRSVRGLTLAYEALMRLQMYSFMQWCRTEEHIKTIPDEVWQHVLNIQESWTQLDQPSKLQGIQKLDELLQQHILPLLQEFREWGCRNSPTFQYWNMFLNAVQLMLLNIRAEREGNWALHLQTSAAMLPYFFCTDRVNYSRWMPVYILDMMDLPQEVQKAFDEGQFSVREVPGAFNGIWSDMGTEKTVIRDAKSDGGIIGLTRKKSALLRWIVTRHITASFSKAVKCRAGEEGSSTNTHKQTKPGSLKQDEVHVTTLVSFIGHTMVNPFEVTEVNQSPNDNTLINISTGMHATEEVKKSLLSAVDIGKQQCNLFVARAFLPDSSGSFYGPISKSKVKTFTSMTKKTKIHRDGKMKQAHIDPELVFRRALAITSCRSDVSFSTVMTHPIGAVPSGLFHQDGTMRKTNKAELSHKLEEEAEGGGVPKLPLYDTQNCHYIRDSMAVIQMMTCHTHDTFQDVAQRYLNSLLRSFNKANTITDVFDQYNMKDSIKSVERTRRAVSGSGSTGSRKYDVKAERPVPPWKKFLSNGDNKASLCNFICEHIITNGPTALQAHPKRSITLAGGLKDGRDVKCITSEGVSDVTELRCNHEEADTRMLLHAVRNQSENTIIRSPDTDVLVLAVHYYKKMDNVNHLWIETGTASTMKNAHRYIPVHEIVKSLAPIIPTILPAFHALTGCDTTSSLAGIGKKTAYKILKANGSDRFADLESLDGDDVPAAKTSAYRFFLQHCMIQRAQKKRNTPT